MSAALPARRTRRPVAPAAPPLRLVRRRRRRRRAMPAAPLLVVALLTAGLVLLLGLNTTTSQRAFRLERLQQRSDQLAREEQALRVELLQLSSPFSLAQRAAALGFVPAPAPVFLHLPVAGRPAQPPGASPATARSAQ